LTSGTAMAISRNQRFRRREAPTSASPESLAQACWAAGEDAFDFVDFKAPKLNDQCWGSKSGSRLRPADPGPHVLTFLLSLSLSSAHTSMSESEKGPKRCHSPIPAPCANIAQGRGSRANPAQVSCGFLAIPTHFIGGTPFAMGCLESRRVVCALAQINP
jgi:hypothetical protein